MNTSVFNAIQETGERKLVLSSKKTLDLDELFDIKTVDETIQILNEYNNLDVEEIYSRFVTNYYGYDGGIEIYYEIYRWETEHETTIRKLAEEKEIEKKNKKLKTLEEKERAELKRLLEKYEASIS